MAQEKLKILLEGDSKSVNDAVKSAGTAFNNLGNTIKNIAIGGGALVLAQKGFQMLENGIKDTITFFKNCTTEAGNAEVQLTKLNTALKSTGNFTQESSDELVKYAESLQSMTAFEDDAIVGVEAMLATFKLSKEEIKVATQATLDLAAATGQDLQSAAILMGKAMVGETGTLKRYGIMVDENKLATQGWKAVIDEINIEFGGQALAQGQTYTGMIERMKNEIGNVKETIGGALLPVLKTLMDNFADKGGALEKFTNWVKTFADALTKANWQPVYDGMNRIGEALGLLIGDSGFQTADEQAQGLVTTLGSMLDKVANLIAPINYVVDASMAATATFKDWIAQIKLISTSTKDIDDYALAVENARIASENADIAQMNAATSAGELIEFYNSGADASYALENGLIAVNGGYVRVKETGDAAAETIKVMADNTDIAAVETKELTDKLYELSPAEVTATDKSDQLKKVIKQMGDVTLESVAEAIKLKEAIAALESKTITITTLYQNIGAYGASYLLTPGAKQGSQQSGGMQLDSRWINDLNIPVVKGEAILPASLTRAIKENRGSFAGLDVNSSQGAKNEIHIHLEYNHNLASKTFAELFAQKVGQLT